MTDRDIIDNIAESEAFIELLNDIEHDTEKDLDLQDLDNVKIILLHTVRKLDQYQKQIIKILKENKALEAIILEKNKKITELEERINK